MSLVRRSRIWVLVATAIVLAGASIVTALALLHGTPNRMAMMSGARPATTAPPAGAATAAPGSSARFAYLVAQTSNRCDLQMGALMGYPDSSRLQGSCCSTMDMAHYAAQVTALKRFRHVTAVPADPYDIPVGLAKQLLSYEHAITLTATEQATFAKAMALSPEKGPCCCHCWRWDAFAGLSRYLIARVHMTATVLGALIGDLDGCGGPGQAA